MHGYVFTSSVFSTQIGKSPDIAESNGIANTRQKKVKFPLPRFSVGKFIFLLNFDHQSFWFVVGGGRFVQLC